MPRRSLRMANASDSETEELQTDLKYGDPNWKNGQMTATKENDTGSEVSLEDDSESDEEKNLASDSDDDAPPESVSFSHGKESALKTVRDAVEQIRAERKRRKENRQLLHCKYTEQKKRRLKALSQARLPDDVLAEISSTPMAQHSTASESADTHRTEEHNSDESHPDDSTDDEIEISKEFLPLQYDRKCGVDIATQNDIKSKTKSLAESAVDFRNKALYGNRIVRETTKSRLLRNKKKKARFE